MGDGAKPNLRDEIKRINEIADGVVHISEAMKRLRDGRLNEKALLILCHHVSGIPMKNIKKVIESLEQLADVFVKQEET